MIKKKNHWKSKLLKLTDQTEDRQEAKTMEKAKRIK